MEEMHHTHKEVAWGWIGAVLQTVRAGRETRPQANGRIVSSRPRAPRGLKVNGC